MVNPIIFGTDSANGELSSANIFTDHIIPTYIILGIMFAPKTNRNHFFCENKKEIAAANHPQRTFPAIYENKNNCIRVPLFLGIPLAIQ